MHRKLTISGLLLAFASSFLLVTCAQPYGSVGDVAVQEALQAESMAVTPCIPGWLLEPEQIHKLSPTELEQVRQILNRSQVRRVHERYYRDEFDGNRGDTTGYIFYLYASNAQCLGGRVADAGEILMDDFQMSDEDARALYSLLRPHLQKLFPEVP